ncbi:nitrous oxide reductase accessory protein NosL [Nibribacter koreensis]
MKALVKVYGWIGMAVALAACSTEPKPVPYGAANCTHCNMTVSDNRFGAELVNDKGKPFYFDAAECLIAYVNERPEERKKASHVLVTDYTKPNTLIDARTAHFYQSKAITSPMGMNLAAVADQTVAIKMKQEQGGRVLTWDQAVTAVQKNERPD